MTTMLIMASTKMAIAITAPTLRVVCSIGSFVSLFATEGTRKERETYNLRYMKYISIHIVSSVLHNVDIYLNIEYNRHIASMPINGSYANTIYIYDKQFQQ